MANVLHLDVTNKAHRAKITALLKTWIANGMFAAVEGLDAKREKRSSLRSGWRPMTDEPSRTNLIRRPRRPQLAAGRTRIERIGDGRARGPSSARRFLYCACAAQGLTGAILVVALPRNMNES